MSFCIKITRFVYKKFIGPRSDDEDLRRREFILNIILLGSIIFLGIANVSVLYLFITLGAEYKGFSPLIPVLVFSIFLSLYFLSRKGFFRITSYVLIVTYFIPTTYAAYRWGFVVPQSLLTYALIIVISSILINTRFASIVTLIISSVIILLTYLQIKSVISPDLSWQNEVFGMDDTLVVVITFSVIALVSWLSNREIEKSLKRARESEIKLKEERDLLEVKVEERARELKRLQMEKMEQLYRSAEFGRLSSGIFHDLVNPLTAVSLSLEQMKDIDGKKLADTRTYLAGAISATKRMENFIVAVRKQIAKQEDKTFFSLSEEIIPITQILSYKARKADVEINFSPTDDIRTYGDSIKFSQVIANLISNAIDAYDGIERFGKRKEVFIDFSMENNVIRLIVQDWGKGIPLEHMNKICEPFFTTKSDAKDLGIGLSIVKNIIKKDFNGNLKVKSKPGEETTFIVELPQKQEPPSRFTA